MTEGTSVVPCTLTCTDGRTSAVADGRVDGERCAATRDQPTATAPTASKVARRATVPRLTNLDKAPPQKPIRANLTRISGVRGETAQLG